MMSTQTGIFKMDIIILDMEQYGILAVDKGSKIK